MTFIVAFSFFLQNSFLTFRSMFDVYIYIVAINSYINCWLPWRVSTVSISISIDGIFTVNITNFHLQVVPAYGSFDPLQRLSRLMFLSYSSKSLFNILTIGLYLLIQIGVFLYLISSALSLLIHQRVERVCLCFLFHHTDSMRVFLLIYWKVSLYSFTVSVSNFITDCVFTVTSQCLSLLMHCMFFYWFIK